MCYLNYLKQCKLSATPFLYYSNQNFNTTLGFTMLVQQNANNAIYLLNRLTHKQLMYSVSLNVSIEQSLLTKNSCLF